MNILIDRLPESVEIDGKEYAINADFRVALKVMQMFEDPELAGAEKVMVMLQMLYPVIPHDVNKAAGLAVKFLDCGEDWDAAKTDAPRRYSFEQDAKYIYTGIQQTHGIDLQRVEFLHWWQFVYLFMDLSGECMFSRIVDLRIRRDSGKLTPEEKKQAANMKDILDLPIIYTAEEKAIEDEFFRLLRGG